VRALLGVEPSILRGAPAAAAGWLAAAGRSSRLSIGGALRLRWAAFRACSEFQLNEKFQSVLRGCSNSGTLRLYRPTLLLLL
jgi:hypothetical protein